MAKNKLLLTLTLRFSLVSVLWLLVTLPWFLVTPAYAATNVYYSVGQNTSDHKTGSPNVTISSGVATFTVAQTAPNLGVGDKVAYAKDKQVLLRW